MAWDGPVSLLLLVTLCRLLVLVLLLRLLVLNVVNPPILLVAGVISRVTGSSVALVPPIVWKLVLIAMPTIVLGRKIKEANCTFCAVTLIAF